MNILNRCLCCNNEVVPLIDFGPQPLVNTYSVTDKYPLSINRCVSCCHLQLNEYVDPAILFTDYAYQSGTGEIAKQFFTSFAKTALTYYHDAFDVLEIASNDGSQLDAFKTKGLVTYGIDPAENLNEIARRKGHGITTGFFEDLRPVIRQRFDILVAQNVLGHTPRPLEFLKTCAVTMHDQSRLFIATSQANMIVNGEIGTVYHEHVSYFNAHSMMKLAERAGLVVLDILTPYIHGTSYVFVMGKTGKPSSQVTDRLDFEFMTGRMSAPLYSWWVKHVQAKIKRLKVLITDYMENGFYTVGVSAAAKGLSMLNMAGVKLDGIFDNTPTKFYKEANGMRIYPFDMISEIKKDKVLFVILAHNIATELRSNAVKLRNNPNDIFITVK